MGFFWSEKIVAPLISAWTTTVCDQEGPLPTAMYWWYPWCSVRHPNVYDPGSSRWFNWQVKMDAADQSVHDWPWPVWIPRHAIWYLQRSSYLSKAYWIYVLGLASYYSRLVKDFAEITSMLLCLTMKSLEKSKSCALKEKLVSLPVIAIACMDLEFILDCETRDSLSACSTYSLSDGRSWVVLQHY